MALSRFDDSFFAMVATKLFVNCIVVIVSIFSC